ncbi:MAG: alpha/beta fold hydrolase [Chthoniobacterales bacterium]
MEKNTIEVAVIEDDKQAPTILLIHGGAGGYDQSLALNGDLYKAGFNVIAPSRPGYLRTPLAEGLLFEHQARLIREMLKKLDIKKVTVFAFAEGAVPACVLAVENPDLVQSLVLLSPVMEVKGRRQPFGLFALDKITGDVGAWWMYRESESPKPRELIEKVFDLTQEFPDKMLRYDLVKETMENPERRERFIKFVRSMTPVSPREEGTRNDDVQLVAPPRIPYAKIQCPVLIIGGENDILLPKGSLKQTSELFKGSSDLQLKIYPESGFLVPLGARSEEYRNDLISFLTLSMAAPQGQITESTEVSDE